MIRHVCVSERKDLELTGSKGDSVSLALQIAQWKDQRHVLLVDENQTKVVWAGDRGKNRVGVGDGSITAGSGWWSDHGQRRKERDLDLFEVSA